MRQVTIRRYKPGNDGSWFNALPDDAHPDKPVRDGNCSTWVTTINGDLVAICTWKWIEPLADSRVRLVRVYVDPDHRRQGHGTRLYRRAANEIRKQYRKAALRLKAIEYDGGIDTPDALGFLQSLKYDIAQHPPTRGYES